MKVLIHSLLFCCILHSCAMAQGPFSGWRPVPDSADAIWGQYMVSEMSRHRAEIASRGQARYREQQFLLRADRLVEAWTEFAREYREKGTFNLKSAKRVSNAFRDLEKMDEWPRADHK